MLNTFIYLYNLLHSNLKLRLIFSTVFLQAFFYFNFIRIYFAEKEQIFRILLSIDFIFFLKYKAL